jgi:hypothetical protein
LPFCHDKILLDWRQSVTTFAHQQKLTARPLPPILNSSSSRYSKKRNLNPSQNRQRSLSLSTIVLHCSKSSLFHHHHHHHSSLKRRHTSNHRRAHSYEELFSSNKNTNPLSIHRQDESTIASGCSLAMDLTNSFDEKNYCSSSTINTDEDENDQEENIDHRIKQFKWKLKISK